MEIIIYDQETIYSMSSPNMIFVARKKIMLAENHVMQVLYKEISIA